MFLDTRSKMHHLCGNCFLAVAFLLSLLIAAQQGCCKRPALSVDPTDLGAYISVFTLEKNGCAKSNCSGWHKTTLSLPRLACFLFLNNLLQSDPEGMQEPKTASDRQNEDRQNARQPVLFESGIKDECVLMTSACL